MGAAGAGGSAADRARAAVFEALDDAGSGTVATLILTGPRPAIVAGPRATRGAIEQRLSRWSPRGASHDFGPSFDLAARVAADSDRIVFVTDHAATPTPPRVALSAVGARSDNVAILSARRTADGRMLVDVVNYGEAPAARVLRVTAPDGRSPIGETRLDVPAHGTVHLGLDVPAATDPVTVALDGDVLAVDDVATVASDEERAVAVLDLLRPETAKLLQLPRVLRSVAGVMPVDDPNAAALVFSESPGTPRPGVVEVVVATAGSARSDWIGPFLIERRHPLTDGLTLDGVVWSGGPTVPGTPLVVAGDSALLVEERAGTARRVTVNLDPSRSNLADSPDWPILVSNFVGLARRSMRGLEARNVAAGRPIVWRRGPDDPPASAFELTSPSGDVRKAPPGEDALLDSTEPGLHQVRVNGAVVGTVAVQFSDPRESDLRDRSTGSRKAATQLAEHAPRSRAAIEPTFLVLAALLMILADWWILRPSRLS
jgi:hypothetical protein